MDGARPATATALTIKLDIFYSKFIWIYKVLCHFCWPDYVIQNGQQGLNLAEFGGQVVHQTYGTKPH